MAVRVEIHKFCKGYAMADGMKVFLESGEEIKDIAYFEMPKTSVNDIMTITLTIPVTDIKFLDNSCNKELDEAKACISYAEATIESLLKDIDILTMQAVKRSVV